MQSRLSPRLLYRRGPLAYGIELRTVLFYLRPLRQQHEANLLKSGVELAELRFVKVQFVVQLRMEETQFSDRRPHRSHRRKLIGNFVNLHHPKKTFAPESEMGMVEQSADASVYRSDLFEQLIR